jgi:hypothetical protein
MTGEMAGRGPFPARYRAIRGAWSCALGTQTLADSGGAKVRRLRCQTADGAQTPFFARPCAVTPSYPQPHTRA